MTDPSDNITLRIESDEGSDELTLPRELMDLLAEGDQTPAETIGDLAMISSAQQIHMRIHHSQGGVPEGLEALETELDGLFEDRFGQTFGEMTGHDH